MAIDVMIEADTTFNLFAYAGRSTAGITLDSHAGTFSLKGNKGKPVTGQAAFEKNTWHTVEVKMEPQVRTPPSFGFRPVSSCP